MMIPLTTTLLTATLMSQPSITSQPWGSVNGVPTRIFTLDNGRGLKARISDYGGTVVSIETPDRNGTVGDITLGFDKVEEYGTASPYFGCIVGRVGNRIGGGTFKLNGKTYKLALNTVAAGKQNTLHGGKVGFDKRIWKATAVPGAEPSLVLTYLSPHLEEGFPGNLRVKVTYTVTKSNILRISYVANTDQATPVNLTNHAYFNLKGAGEGDTLDHILQIDADRFTPTDDGLIPTGELAKVAGTPFDFRKPQVIGSRVNTLHPQLEAAGGYDHNFVLSKRLGAFGRAARVVEPESGRWLEVWTHEPGVQFYGGNFLDGTVVGKGGKRYLYRGGFCLETQHFPDSVNKPTFPTTILRPGKTLKTVTEYRFGTVAR